MRDHRPTTVERDDAASFAALQHILNQVYDDFSWLDLGDTVDNGIEENAFARPWLSRTTPVIVELQ